MQSIKSIAAKTIINNQIGRKLWLKTIDLFFKGSADYWETRYKKNGNSGVGSYGKNAEYKATIINEFVKQYAVKKVVEFGCGDGNQLQYFIFPEYTGLDVSVTVIKRCQAIYINDNSKHFLLYNGKTGNLLPPDFKADLVISLDVIFHLVEDVVFEKYMKDLFGVSTRHVIIYAWDVDEKQKSHVRQRHYSKWIADNIIDFYLKEHISPVRENKFCDFFIYEKTFQTIGC